MEIRQVFSNENDNRQDGTGPYCFCPMCGTRLSLNAGRGETAPRCPGCGFVQYRNPLPGVVVLIEDGGSVLLGRRQGGFGAGKWGLPQGYIEFEEDFLSAAIREVEEETGLEVEIRGILNVVSNHLSPSLHTLAIMLLAGVVAGEPRAADDLEALEWVPLDGTLPEMAFEADQFIIERYRQLRGEDALPVDGAYARGVCP